MSMTVCPDCGLGCSCNIQLPWPMKDERSRAAAERAKDDELDKMVFKLGFVAPRCSSYGVARMFCRCFQCSTQDS